MPYVKDGLYHANNTNTKKVGASQTTAQISAAGDMVPGVDYVDRIVVIANSTAAPGAVTLFDGTTSICVHNAQITAYTGTNVYIYPIGAVATSTKGFNVTTGTSVSVVVIGRFSG